MFFMLQQTPNKYYYYYNKLVVVLNTTSVIIRYSFQNHKDKIKKSLKTTREYDMQLFNTCSHCAQNRQQINKKASNFSLILKTVMLL